MVFSDQIVRWIFEIINFYPGEYETTGNGIKVFFLTPVTLPGANGIGVRMFDTIKPFDTTKPEIIYKPHLAPFICEEAALYYGYCFAHNFILAKDEEEFITKIRTKIEPVSTNFILRDLSGFENLTGLNPQKRHFICEAPIFLQFIQSIMQLVGLLF